MKYWFKSLLSSLVIILVLFIVSLEEINKFPQESWKFNFVEKIQVLSIVFVLLFIAFSLIWWFIEVIKFKGLISWLSSKPYWQTGAILGGLISLIPFLSTVLFGMTGLFDLWGNLLGFRYLEIFTLPMVLTRVMLTGKFFSYQYHGEEGLVEIIVYPVSILVNVLLGALIGFIIAKLKSK